MRVPKTAALSRNLMHNGGKMGINIAVCELEAERASCRILKTDIRKALLKDVTGFEQYADYDTVVSLEDAAKAFPDWESFAKRNRISESADAVYMESVKNPEDAGILREYSKDVPTGWVDLERMPADMAAKARDSAVELLSGWDMIGFDEMKEACANCPLSWDKGRGCIGAFGPDESLLPRIADKYGCTIVASVPASVSESRRFAPADAAALLKEIEELEAALPKEGKMMVRRYAGPLERMKAVAKISQEEGCGFFFF